MAPRARHAPPAQPPLPPSPAPDCARRRTIFVRLLSQAGTGFFYTVKRPRVAEKIVLRKYDPVVRRHVLFKETKKK